VLISRAEVYGIHLLDWAERAGLRDALRRHPVVHLRAPRLDEDELLELAAGLGAIEPTLRPAFAVRSGSPLMRIGNLRDAAGKPVAGSALDFGWHSDMSYRADPPALTLLHAIEVPSRGGDTHYASLYRLFDSLDAETRAAWSELEVEHVTRSAHIARLDDHAAVHPLVRHHPDSGRPLLFASPAYMRRVLGLDAERSAAILARIAAAIEPPDIVHRWQPGDLVVWDNRAALHRATPHDPAERRELWRLSVQVAS
jgi:taurine dioxygenase